MNDKLTLQLFTSNIMSPLHYTICDIDTNGAAAVGARGCTRAVHASLRRLISLLPATGRNITPFLTTTRLLRVYCDF